MYNDLIFPILPRNTKVPVVGDNRIKKVSPYIKTDTLNQDEREQHEATHRVDERQVHEQHKRVEAKQKKERKEQQDEQHASDDSKADNTDAEPTENAADDSSQQGDGRKHLDIYV